MNEFKRYILEYAELCNLKIKFIRKSKDNLGYHVYGLNGEKSYLYLRDFIDRNYIKLRNELHRSFKKPIPKVVRII